MAENRGPILTDRIANSFWRCWRDGAIWVECGGVSLAE